MFVGRSIERTDGHAKVSGKARFIDDLSFPGMLHARTVRSTIARGTIRSIDLGFDPDDGFTLVDHRDIPGRNVIALIDPDQPCLVDREIRHSAEPILLIAHPDRERLRTADVNIAYDVLEPVLNPEESQIDFRTIHVEQGDLERGFVDADLILEGEYHTGHQEQLYIETNGVIAVPQDGGITLYGSLQCPYYVHRALMELLALPADRVRVIQAETGGGFGGKEEYPSMIAGHAALLALKSGKPVKLIHDRVEDMLATTKRHPFRVRHRTGVKSDGELVAVEIDILTDGGAYCTLTPVVLSRAAIHAVGPYRCSNVRITGRAVMTNTPPNGAFRGFGAPQTLFAAEVHMDRIAEAIGLDPVAIRERNALRPGDRTVTGGHIGEDGSALDVLREAVRRSRFRAKRRAYRGTKRGIGLALFFHGSGFTGGGEARLASRASLELTDSGVRILSATVDIGQGTRTVHAQIVADTLGIPMEQVALAEPDTAAVPDSGPTVASRTTMVVCGILQRCAQEMKERLGGVSPAEYFRRNGPLVVSKVYQPPPGLQFDDDTYEGDAYGTYAWGCDVAEVELDPDTYQVRPLRLTAVQEIGKAVNPALVRGQIEGGSAQGIGFALYEEVVMRAGAMANAQLTNYIIPTTRDTPDMDVVILERPYAHGPFGAKGVGELPIDGPAPAIVNALRHLGVDVRTLPATPERIMEAMCASK
jgi:CO/xanthine dehydrogenase Mo-binding subunit